jgi:hypothetical protein
MLTIIVAGRNDDYGKDFKDRLFRTARHNCQLLRSGGMDFEYILAEWNPLPDRPLLSEEFVARVPNARAVIIPPEIHRTYTLNPQMPFHEMPAKNAALRRAKGDFVIITNADILFSERLVDRIASGGFDRNTLYRAHRIDVKPELSWEEIQNPANQLPSGEGFLPPPYYLGAGGDFCLAARDLWHSLRGFNERIRFSTRAKDWQFFLSAAAQDVSIEFIGDVYHLDHEGGFRNTVSADLNNDRVHFGKWWDIEFGLPVANADSWGLHAVPEDYVGGNPRILALNPGEYAISEEEERIDREVMTWLTRPADSNETEAAVLFHAICAAHRQGRRLVCRLGDPRLAATLSGLESVASPFGVEICCNWVWPATEGFRIHAFAPEPEVLQDLDWIVEETPHGIQVYESGTQRNIDILPKTFPINKPEFNPVLARRLLRICLQLQLQSHGTKRIAIYGGGSHTLSLLRWGLPDTLELAGIVGTSSLPGVQSMNVDAVLLSSASFESDMSEAAKQHGLANVISLYGDWPGDGVMAELCVRNASARRD